MGLALALALALELPLGALHNVEREYLAAIWMMQMEAM